MGNHMGPVTITPHSPARRECNEPARARTTRESHGAMCTHATASCDTHAGQRRAACCHTSHWHAMHKYLDPRPPVQALRLHQHTDRREACGVMHTDNEQIVRPDRTYRQGHRSGTSPITYRALPRGTHRSRARRSTTSHAACTSASPSQRTHKCTEDACVLRACCERARRRVCQLLRLPLVRHHGN